MAITPLEIDRESEHDKLVPPGPSGKPVTTRPSSSFPDVTTSSWVQGLFQSYAGLGYALSFEVLDYVELLSTWNPDFSQAVDNIRTLANAGHELFIDDASQRRAAKVKADLEAKASTINGQHGGIDGLIDKLLDQAAVYGAMCGEWILTDDLTDVTDFQDVNPKNIRFFWDAEVDRFAPYQKVNATQQQIAKDRGQEVKNGCVRLNENTFHYYAFDAAPGSPYGTPPFLAALPNIAIQRDMIANMAQIVKKVGLLGMIDISIKSLAPKAGEQPGEYQARAENFLNNYVSVVEDMVRDGGIAHFDDVEVSTYQLAGNAAGATNIFKQNEELIFSGLKSMPSVQGRSYSTTETYAGVAYDIIIRNTYKYQRAVKRMIEAGYWLMVILWGEQVDAIRLVFNQNKSLHRLQDAQAFRMEIFNAVLMWALGIWNQQDVAQALGQQEPRTAYADVPASPLLAGGMPTVGIGAKSAGDGEQPATQQEARMAKVERLVQRITEIISEEPDEL